MVLNWNEIRKRAIEFSREWRDAKREKAEAQTFWNEFFRVFGISRKHVASFEEPVKKLDDATGWIEGQVLNYMGWVQENLAKKGQKVRGLIIVGKAEKPLKMALKPVSDKIKLKEYRMKIKLVESK